MLVPQRHYKMISPIKTHFRQATCAEIGCPLWATGWITPVDESTPDGKKTGQYLRAKYRGGFIEKQENGLTLFRFLPERVPCFNSSQHRIRSDQPPILLRTADDHQPYQHKNIVEWVEDFSEHQTRLTNAAR